MGLISINFSQDRIHMSFIGITIHSVTSLCGLVLMIIRKRSVEIQRTQFPWVGKRGSMNFPLVDIKCIDKVATCRLLERIVQRQRRLCHCLVSVK